MARDQRRGKDHLHRGGWCRASGQRYLMPGQHQFSLLSNEPEFAVVDFQPRRVGEKMSLCAGQT